MPGRAVTVTGEVASDELGIVLPHEHLNCTSTFLCTDPTASRAPVESLDRTELRARPMSFVANLDMRDEAIAVSEVDLFLAARGRTIVDMTSDEVLGRDPELLLRVARRTGVNVVMGTGFYVEAAHPPVLASMSVEAIAARMLQEIREGVGAQRVRAGIIGEIGTGDPLLSGEERVLRAAAVAHLETGCPINIHMAAGCREVFRILDILRTEGVEDLSRTVISHMDVVIDHVQHREVAATGAMVEYDTFGHERYPDSRGFLMPSDRERVGAVVAMLEAGYEGKLLLSQDVCFRHLWRHHGGWGYTNILDRIRPMLREAGVSDAIQTGLLVDNPARVLAYLGDP